MISNKQEALDKIRNAFYNSIFENISVELLADREFIFEAMRWNGSWLQIASEELKSDREFILEAVKQNRARN